MSNSERAFMRFMVFFSVVLVIVCWQLALWYWARDILSTMVLFIVLGATNAVRAYQLNKMLGSKSNG